MKFHILPSNLLKCNSIKWRPQIRKVKWKIIFFCIANVHILGHFLFTRNAASNLLFGPTGSCKLTCVRLFVRSFVCYQLFSRSAHLFFMIFGKKVQNGNAQNVTESDFGKKNFWANLGPKMPKNRVFWTLWKICSLL